MNPTNNLRGIPDPNSIDVLFVAYGGGHIRARIPVAQTLRAQGYEIVVFITTAAVCKANELPHFTYADLPQASDEDVSVKAAFGQSFSISGQICLKKPELIGHQLCDLVQQHGLGKANDLYGRTAEFFPINSMASCLAYLKPRILITTNSPRSEPPL